MSYYNDNIGGIVGLIILFAIFAFLLVPYLVMITWNWLMPQLFAGVGLLTWWKAFFLCLMIRLMVWDGFRPNISSN